MGQQLPIPSVPTTAKEFLRLAVYGSGLLLVELTTGLVSGMLGVEIQTPVTWWQALLLFAVFLGIFSWVDGLQRAGHLKEQGQVAARVVEETTPPSPPGAGPG